MDPVRFGAQGPFVSYVQLALDRAGMMPGPIDGLFGPQTEKAVRIFQTQEGLNADGIVGPATRLALTPYLVGYRSLPIRVGDTFYQIARSYGTTVTALITANPDLDPTNLPIGGTVTVPFSFRTVPTGVPYTAFLVDQIVTGLTARYPFIRATEFGRSVMGRPLHALCIGRGPTHVLYNAAHHANEWITTPVLLRFLEEYAAAYAHNGSLHGQSASNLFDSTTLTVVPLVNPDGVDLVTGALPNESPFFINAQQLAFNYPAVPFPDGWKANILGVDLNLNYPAGWEEAKKIKESQGYTQPGPRDYVGPAPFSEPESAALAALTEAHSYRLTLSYHTQGEVIYYKYLDFQPPYALAIGQAFSRASGYALEQTPYESGFAGYKDWFIQSFDRPGYTIEAGRGTNPLPLGDFDSIYRDNLGILVQGLVLVR